MTEFPNYIETNGHQIAVKAYNEHLTTTPIVFVNGVLASYKFWEATLPIFFRKPLFLFA